MYNSLKWFSFSLLKVKYIYRITQIGESDQSKIPMNFSVTEIRF